MNNIKIIFYFYSTNDSHVDLSITDDTNCAALSKWHNVIQHCASALYDNNYIDISQDESLPYYSNRSFSRNNSHVDVTVTIAKELDSFREIDVDRLIHRDDNSSVFLSRIIINDIEFNNITDANKFIDYLAEHAGSIADDFDLSLFKRVEKWIEKDYFDLLTTLE